MPIARPRLARSAAPRPGAGILHLGPGAFFRAHGALYIEEAMAKSGGDWGIVGVSLMSAAMRDRLAPQGFAYTAVGMGPEGERPRIVELFENILVAPEDPEAVLAAMADPAIRIVTLTVTEKGYCHEPATGRLDPAHPDIIHDLAHPDAPRSAPGYLVRALAQRRAAGLRPFSVLSCDNLPRNGAVARRVTLDLAAEIDPALGDWIAAEGRFPATMVDRIVPATGPGDIARTAELTGYDDAAPVLHEPFRQWVIEDDFVDGARPDLAAAGAEMVRDVAAFEHMKLRMLNGAHSALAYLGYLGGHETIAEAVADPVYARFVRQLWRAEIIPALTPPPGVDLSAYADVLFERFANPAIRHRTWQIAMDGSQKLPQRILETIGANREAGRPSPGLHLTVAAWMRYVGGVDENGAPIDVRDPLAGRLRALSGGAPDRPGRVAALLSLRQVFTQEQAEALRDEVSAAYRALARHGARDTVKGIAR